MLMEIKDPRLADVTVIEVQVTPDLRLAKVFVSVLGGEEAGENALQGLRHAAGYIRREVAQRLQLRFAPELMFLLDDYWQRGARVDQLLHQLHSEAATGDEPASSDRQVSNTGDRAATTDEEH